MLSNNSLGFQVGFESVYAHLPANTGLFKASERRLWVVFETVDHYPSCIDLAGYAQGMVVIGRMHIRL